MTNARPATVRGSLWCCRRSRTNRSTRVTGTRREGPSCARLAPRESSWRSPCRIPVSQHVVLALKPGCCSAVHRVGTNTDDRGYQPSTENAQGSRCPALRQNEVGHDVRFLNRNLVAHSSHPRQVRPVLLGLRSFFFSVTLIGFSTPRPLWFAFASRASCILTRCLIWATHSHQEMQGSADSVSRCATGSAPCGTGGKRSNTPAFHGDAWDQRRRGPASRWWLLAPPLSLPVAATDPGRHSPPHVLVQPASLTPGSASRETRGTPNKHLFLALQPTRYLPRRHGIRRVCAGPRGQPVTGTGRVKGCPEAARMVALVRPPSPPPAAHLSIFRREVRNAEVGQHTEEDGDPGTHRRL